MTKPTTGIAGTGRMGTAFARRLLECGFTVAVWNRTPGRTAESLAAGATAAPDLAALAASDVILLSLTDAAAVEAVVSGLIEAGVRGGLVEEAGRAGIPLPLAEAARRSYRAALDAGLGRFEGASLSRRVALGEGL